MTELMTLSEQVLTAEFARIRAWREHNSKLIWEAFSRQIPLEALAEEQKVIDRTAPDAPFVTVVSEHAGTWPNATKYQIRQNTDDTYTIDYYHHDTFMHSETQRISRSSTFNMSSNTPPKEPGSRNRQERRAAARAENKRLLNTLKRKNRL